jgi:thiamine biosynthesis lipoprotein
MTATERVRDLAPGDRATGAGEPLQATFRAMGCTAHIVIHGGGHELLVAAERRIHELESLWSRFRETSDITIANRAAGRPVVVDPDTLAVVERAITGWQQTGGAFDVTVLPHLLAHGYTHSTTTAAPAPVLSATRSGASGSIVLDFAASTLTVPAGAAVDLGGIGKGFAADIVAEDLVAGGASGALVNIGGDLAVYGEPAPGASWYLGIDDPARRGHHLTCVRVGSGGVATSGTTIRRWTTASGQRAHHLIDPSTARPSRAGLATVTVLAADAATAEVFATAAMMQDGAGAMAMLERHGLAGLGVGDDGRVYRSSTFAVFEA